MSDGSARKESGIDAQLVKKTLQGNTQAFGRLVHTHSKRAYSIAYSVLSDFQAAQDVTQEAFVRAHTKISALKSPEKFGTWVDTITRNLARKALQRRRRDQVSLTDFSDPASHPVTEDKRETPMLQEALNSLPGTYREPLVMRYMGGVSYEGIAEILGTSRNTAEVRVHRAKKMLKEALVQSGRLK